MSGRSLCGHCDSWLARRGMSRHGEPDFETLQFQFSVILKGWCRGLPSAESKRDFSFAQRSAVL